MFGVAGWRLNYLALCAQYLKRSKDGGRGAHMGRRFRTRSGSLGCSALWRMSFVALVVIFGLGSNAGGQSGNDGDLFGPKNDLSDFGPGAEGSGALERPNCSNMRAQ